MNELSVTEQEVKITGVGFDQAMATAVDKGLAHGRALIKLKKEATHGEFTAKAIALTGKKPDYLAKIMKGVKKWDEEIPEEEKEELKQGGYFKVIEYRPPRAKMDYNPHLPQTPKNEQSIEMLKAIENTTKEEQKLEPPPKWTDRKLLDYLGGALEEIEKAEVISETVMDLIGQLYEHSEVKLDKVVSVQ